MDYYISKKSFDEKFGEIEKYEGQSFYIKASKKHKGNENCLVEIQLGKKQTIQSLIDLGIEYNACVYLKRGNELVEGSWEDNWMNLPFPEENKCIRFKF